MNIHYSISSSNGPLKGVNSFDNLRFLTTAIPPISSKNRKRSYKDFLYGYYKNDYADSASLGSIGYDNYVDTSLIYEQYIPSSSDGKRWCNHYNKDNSIDNPNYSKSNLYKTTSCNNNIIIGGGDYDNNNYYNNDITTRPRTLSNVSGSRTKPKKCLEDYYFQSSRFQSHHPNDDSNTNINTNTNTNTNTNNCLCPPSVRMSFACNCGNSNNNNNNGCTVESQESGMDISVDNEYNYQQQNPLMTSSSQHELSSFVTRSATHPPLRSQSNPNSVSPNENIQPLQKRTLPRVMNCPVCTHSASSNNTNVWTSCTFCSKQVCIACICTCEKCTDEFCKFCITLNFSGSFSRQMCIDCDRTT